MEIKEKEIIRFLEICVSGVLAWGSFFLNSYLGAIMWNLKLKNPLSVALWIISTMTTILICFGLLDLCNKKGDKKCQMRKRT
jgi:hypothetical protein